MHGVLQSLVIDVEHDHNTRETARRVAKMYVNEVFRGRYVPLPHVTEFPNASHLNELMIVGPITVRSACSHHLCPIMGRLWIGVMPNEHSNLIGLSKYSRIADWIMSRPQIQEEAIIQLADLLVGMVKPDGLAVVMEADHFCMHWRGVKDNASKMINSVMRGVFLKDGALRREFLSLINLVARWQIVVVSRARDARGWLSAALRAGAGGAHRRKTQPLLRLLAGLAREGGRATGRNQGTVQTTEPGVSRHAARLLGLRARAVRRQANPPR